MSGDCKIIFQAKDGKITKGEFEGNHIEIMKALTIIVLEFAKSTYMSGQDICLEISECIQHLEKEEHHKFTEEEKVMMFGTNKKGEKMPLGIIKDFKIRH